jgi:hypothetical protein
VHEHKSEPYDQQPFAMRMFGVSVIVLWDDLFTSGDPFLSKRPGCLSFRKS